MTASLLLPPGVTSKRLHQALEACEQVAARDQSSLYVTSQFFADRARYHAFIATYAVMRVIDDFVDAIADKAGLPQSARQRLLAELDQWEARIRAAYNGTPGPHFLDVALSASVLTFPIPLRVWLNFLSAMRFDVEHPRFKDFNQFLAYSEGASAAPTIIYVTLLTSLLEADGSYRVRDFDVEACGRALGVFAYVAHILRDVKADLAVGETGLLYLAESDLAAHRLTEADLRLLLARGNGDSRWHALVADLCGRARNSECEGRRHAESHYAHMPADCAFILCLIITVYSELLSRIEQAPDAVLRGDALLDDRDRARLAEVAAHRTGYGITSLPLL